MLSVVKEILEFVRTSGLAEAIVLKIKFSMCIEAILAIGGLAILGSMVWAFVRNVTKL